jgi:hypothetical protein
MMNLRHKSLHSINPTLLKLSEIRHEALNPHQEQKDAKKAEEEKEEDTRRVQHAANALIREHKRLEKEGKDATTQLALELLMENSDLESPSPKQTKSKAIKAKTSAPTVPKSNPKRQAPKVLVKQKSKESKAVPLPKIVEREVIAESSRGRKTFASEHASKNK